MSLINEALKKAQSQQTPARTNAPTAAPSPIPAPLAPGSPNTTSTPGLLTLALVFSGIAAVFMLGTGLIVWGLRPDRTAQGPQVAEHAPDPLSAAAPRAPATESQPPPLTPNATIQSPAPSAPNETVGSIVALSAAVPNQPPAGPATPTPPPAANNPATTEVEVASITGGTPRDPTSSAPPTTDRQSPRETRIDSPQATGEVPRRVAFQPETAPPPVAAPAQPQPDPAAGALVAALEIRGIMAGLQRVLIFNPQTERSTAYEIGSVVSKDPQLTVRAIGQRSITFEDHAGFPHEKRF